MEVGFEIAAIICNQNKIKKFINKQNDLRIQKKPTVFALTKNAFTIA